METEHANYDLFTTAAAPLGVANDSLLGHNMTDIRAPSTKAIALSVFLAVICVVGLIGNGLVIFVITRYTKMKTVTNMYILNLSVADFFFLLGLPLIMVVSIKSVWVFGAAMCKIYFIQTCINWFTGTFTLVVMSGDRFLAVCYPIQSMRYRTPRYALCAISLIWVVSIVVMLPIILFANLIPNGPTGMYTCNIDWPSENPAIGNQIFILYIFLLGFVLPVALICVFYTLLVVRLRTTGGQLRNQERRRGSHRKVTKIVTLIIVVFIACWLPYWSFQIHLIFFARAPMPSWLLMLNFAISILSYANSAVNPLLYAFTNGSFRDSFISAFRCAKDPILPGTTQVTGRRWSEQPSNNHTALLASAKSGPAAIQEAQTDCELTVLTREHHQACGEKDMNNLANLTKDTPPNQDTPLTQETPVTVNHEVCENNTAHLVT